jgi:hypothetical protein
MIVPLYASEVKIESTLSLCSCNAKRCVTSRVRPVRHCPPSEVIPAERTSRSDGESLHMKLISYKVRNNYLLTSVAHATMPEKIIVGSGE